MNSNSINYQYLSDKIIEWGEELGFSQLGICDIDLLKHEKYLLDWLDNNYHGSMSYMQKHGLKRARPAELLTSTIRVISVRLDYLPKDAKFASVLKAKDQAYISRYALGRDYHKLMRRRLQQLGEKITEYCADFNFRAFVDSAPVLERPLAEKAGLGWVGKHSLLLNRQAGSWFFLGELLVNIPLIVTENKNREEHCGKCVACIKICPTQAIVKPYVVDSRRCISYFTIESSDPIPVELRPLMGNRIYGCDDCQLVCPWNKYASLSVEKDFQARNNLDNITLLELFSWTEQHFLSTLRGSAIRRIGIQNWLRNIAVALGNAPFDPEIVKALNHRLEGASELLAEHINWAIQQQKSKENNQQNKLNKQDVKLIRAIEITLPRDA